MTTARTTADKLRTIEKAVYWFARDWGYSTRIHPAALVVYGHGHELTITDGLHWEDNRGDRGQYKTTSEAIDHLRGWMLTDVEPFEVTEPGMYPMSDARYFADPVPEGSLSTSRAKVLLSAGGPAKYQHALTVGEVTTDAFEFGKAAHRAILSTGSAYYPIDAPDRRAPLWKSEAPRARAAGLIPLLRKDADAVAAMTVAVLNHDLAGDIVTDEGEPELAMFAQDPDTGIWLRGKLDLLTPGGVVDYKTSNDASADAFARAVIAYGYHVQDAMYRRLVRLTRADVPDRMRFIVQDKKAPYLVAVYELDDKFRALGEAELDRAIDLFGQCRATNTWPGYSTDLVTLTPPKWALRGVETDAEYEARIASDLAAFEASL